MALKHKGTEAGAVDQEPKKCKRVGFAATDAGIEPNDCIKIFAVKNEEEVGSTNCLQIEPVDLNHFFGEDGKIYGYNGLQNELAILEFIHLLVEKMFRHFGNVCELDIMFHLEKVHFMLEEMVMNGCIVETSKTNILSPIQLMEKAS